MRTTYKFSRKYNGEEYKFFLNEPEYPGEKGILGIEIEPYVSVKTPENCFGYDDTVLLDKPSMLEDGKPYTLNRGLPTWILKGLGKQMNKLYRKEILET
jgi:hypothetical protein